MGVSRYARDKFQKDLTNNSSARANIMVKYDLILTQIHEKNSHSRSGDQFLFFFRKYSWSLKTHFNVKMSEIRQKKSFIIYFFVRPQPYLDPKMEHESMGIPLLSYCHKYNGESKCSIRK